MPEYIEDREARLKAINAELAERKLKPLKRIGRGDKGEIEFLYIKEFVESSTEFVPEVIFACRYPDGAEGEFKVFFNADGIVSDGAVVIVQIGRSFILTRQFRPTLGEWRTELPRSFGDTSDQMTVNDLPIGTALAQLDEELDLAAKISQVLHLGKVAENSGTSNIEYDVWYVRVEVKDFAGLEERIDKSRLTEDGIGLRTITQRTLRTAVGTYLKDAHTLSALYLLEMHSLARQGRR